MLSIIQVQNKLWSDIALTPNQLKAFGARLINALQQCQIALPGCREYICAAIAQHKL